MRRPFPVLLALLVVSGCASAPPPPSAPTTSEQRTGVLSALAVERQWLGQWFRGTPVQIVQRNNGALSIDVPLEFSFEPGRSRVKPALAAVLDKVAESLGRVPLAQVVLLAAPADPTGAPALALERAARIQEHLRSRGVRAERFGKPSAAAAPTVQLRLEAAPVRTPAAAGPEPADASANVAAIAAALLSAVPAGASPPPGRRSSRPS